MQGVFLSDEEVEKVVEFAKQQEEPDYIDESYFEDPYDDEPSESVNSNDDEELWDAALQIAYERNGASASFLQRRLKIGYNRAARIIEEMEEQGILGPQNGSKPRELLRYQ
jgi:S-DNA-T family DNA segregation ATPase FtsK/SpoIIIE